MESVTRFITKKLKLKVNDKKSAVDKPSKRSILGYSFTVGVELKLRISPKSQKRFKERIREITRRTRGISLRRMIEELMRYIKGWMGYYRWCQTKSVLETLDGWIRRRLRCFVWKSWKTYRNRVKELTERGVRKELVYGTAKSKKLWSTAKSEAVHIALPNEYFKKLGVIPLTALVKV